MGDSFTVQFSFKGKSAYLDDVTLATSRVDLIDEARKAYKTKSDVLLKLLFKKETIAEEITDAEGNIGVINGPAFPPDAEVGRMGAKVSVKATKIVKKKVKEDPNRFRDDGVWGTYDGQLDDEGLRNGAGKMVWEDDNQYDGEWKNDKQDGMGLSIYSNGGSYSGEHRRGKRHGVGKYVHQNGDVYEGEYKMNLRDGMGSYTVRNGERYVGQYKAGNKHGRGALYMKDGSVDVGIYGESGKNSGEGVHLTNDRKVASLVLDGNEVREIGMAEARATMEKMGFTGEEINDAMRP